MELATFQIYEPNLPADIGDLGLNHEKINICHEPNVKNLNYDKFNIITGAKWCEGLDIDHIIPKRLSDQIKNIRRMLESDENLRLVHHDCYKNKTSYDKKMYKIFEKSIKTKMNHAINLLAPNERLKVHEKHPINKITLGNLSNNIGYKILKFGLLKLLEDLMIDKVYSLQHIKNKAGDTTYRQNKEVSILSQKLINAIMSPENKTDTNVPIKKRPPSHRLAALRRASDKKSKKIR